MVLVSPDVLVIAFSAAAVVAAALLSLPAGRVPLPGVVAAVSVLSILAGLLYRGPPDSVGVWGIAELAGLAVFAGRAARWLPTRQMVLSEAVIAVAVAGLSLRATLRIATPNWQESLTGALVYAFPLACAIGVGLYLRSLDERRVAAVVRARRTQRLDVARDLHDFVAHEVTGIVLEAQAAQLGDHNPDHARDLYRRIEESGLRALTSMDHTLRMLREPGEREQEPRPTRLYGLHDLPDLLDRFTATGPARAELCLDHGLDATLSREAGTTIYHVVLEALTNVRRHARTATRVTVSVRATPGPKAAVSIIDNGRGSGITRRGRRAGGTGLAALSERVEAVGGAFTAGPEEDGWRVGCILPVEVSAREP
ncbi:histidine kinase [Nonomuraea sp. B5E05]|uniref:sensor histidine kinase n=1 Tax=Nonomuraea sp. B5E05 TaxID=3153569 RepID=UPI0032605949